MQRPLQSNIVCPRKRKNKNLLGILQMNIFSTLSFAIIEEIASGWNSDHILWQLNSANGSLSKFSTLQKIPLTGWMKDFDGAIL